MSSEKKTAPATVDEYFASIPSEEARQLLSRIREIVREEVPSATEIITYGMPTFKLEKPFFWYAAFKKHCSIFGQPVALFAEELKGYAMPKGTLQFRHGKPLPEATIRALIHAQLADQLAKKQN